MEPIQIITLVVFLAVGFGVVSLAFLGESLRERVAALRKPDVAWRKIDDLEEDAGTMKDIPEDDDDILKVAEEAAGAAAEHGGERGVHRLDGGELQGEGIGGNLVACCGQLRGRQQASPCTDRQNRPATV